MPEHNNNPDDMWLSNAEPKPWFRLDAGEVVRLDQLRIWNYNETGGTFWMRGVKTATIKYASEGQVANLNDRNDPGWTVLAANVPFTRADQTNAYETVDEFFFGTSGPAVGRYVLIDVQANYGDNYTGLAEVQLFGLRPLSGVRAVASSQLAPPYNYSFNRPAANTVDGVGKTTTAPDGNPGSGSGMWLSAGIGFPSSNVSDTNPQITFDLGLPYALDALVLYNYNEPGAFTNRGVQQAEILISFDESFSDARSLGVFTFNKAPGNASNPGQTALLGGLVARYVRLDILSNYNGARYHDGVYGADYGFVGLNEVQFLGTLSIPEPGTMVLLGIGLATCLLGAQRQVRRRSVH